MNLFLLCALSLFAADGFALSTAHLASIPTVGGGSPIYNTTALFPLPHCSLFHSISLALSLTIHCAFSTTPMFSLSFPGVFALFLGKKPGQVA